MSSKEQVGFKVAAIEVTQDLKNLELDDLLRKHLICEIHLKEEKGQGSRKGTTLKVSKEGCTSNEEEPNDEEAFSFIIQGLNKMGLKKRFNNKGFSERGSTFRRNKQILKGKFTN